MRFVTRTFDRFGGIGLCVMNVVPGIRRSLMTIPAGLSKYPVGRFLVFTTLGNGFYMLLLVAVARRFIDLLYPRNERTCAADLKRG